MFKATLIAISLIGAFGAQWTLAQAPGFDFIRKHCPSRYGFMPLPGANFNPDSDQNVDETCNYIAALDRILDARLNQLRNCYERELLYSPNMTQITIPMTIGWLNGRMFALKQPGNSEAYRLRQCIETTIEQITVPKDFKYLMFSGRFPFAIR